MAALLIFLAPQDTKLQPRVAVGEKWTVSVDSALDLEIVIKDGEGEATRHLSVVRREKFQQEVTRVADGRAAGLTLQCLSSTLQESGTNIALGTSPTALSGKSFVATRTADGWSVKDLDGRPAPAEGRALGAWNDYARLFPRGGAVKANDTWKVEGSDLADLLFNPGTTGVAGQVDCSVESLAGGRATILFKGSVEGRAKDGSAVVLTLSGSRLVFDTRSGKAVSLTVNGALESKRDVLEPFRKAGAPEDEWRKIGEVVSKSRKLEVSFVFE